MIIKIKKSPLYPNCFSIRDKFIYEAKRNGEPIIIETPDGQKSEPISPKWILDNIKPYDEPSRYFTEPMKFYRTPYKVLTKEEKEEKSKKLLMQSII